MAHFAQIDYGNEVVHVSVVRNEDITDENGNEIEEIGVKFLKCVHGESTRWIQTSYNNNFRCRYAGIGMRYNVEHDVFLLPKPHDSWVLNTNTFEWEPPTPKPVLSESQGKEGLWFDWSEDDRSWVLNQLS